jgi:hypothetical protein
MATLGSELERILKLRRWTEAQGSAVLAEMRRSGLPLGKFAKRHHLNRQRLHRWAHASNSKDLPILFEEVPVDAARVSSDAGLELRLDAGRVLKIGVGFDEPSLRRLLAVLEGC